MTETVAPNAPASADARVPSAARRFVLHCPDITLKGQNQDYFQRRLHRNVRQVLGRLGCDWHVGSARGRVYVDCDGTADSQRGAAIEALARTAGISTLGDALWLRRGEVLSGSGEFQWQALEQAALQLARAHHGADRSYAVRSNRTDKTLPVKSMDIDRRLGAVLGSALSWKGVDLSHPDVVLHIDIYPDGFYLYTPKHHGVGGLPVGTTGRALALLSGGIDSPVAATMLAKRGCAIDALHVAAGHVRAESAADSVVAQLARALSRYTVSLRLYVVPYTYFDLALRGTHGGLELMLFRRFLMRCGERLALQLHAGALIAGDSLGQVASQTMENLDCATRAVSIPVWRPLIGMNKQEIIDLARRAGTYDISIRPYKDCCSLIGQSPHTRTRDAQLAALEQQVFPDYAALLERTFAETLRLDFDCGELVIQEVTAP